MEKFLERRRIRENDPEISECETRLAVSCSTVIEKQMTAERHSADRRRRGAAEKKAQNGINSGSSAWEGGGESVHVAITGRDPAFGVPAEPGPSCPAFPDAFRNRYAMVASRLMQISIIKRWIGDVVLLFWIEYRNHRQNARMGAFKGPTVSRTGSFMPPLP
jgi:hypothetical protein